MNPRPLAYRIAKTGFWMQAAIFAVACWGCGKGSNTGGNITPATFDSAFHILSLWENKDSAVAFIFRQNTHADAKIWGASFTKCADSLFIWNRAGSARLLLTHILAQHQTLTADSAGSALWFKALCRYEMKFNYEGFDADMTSWLEKAVLLMQRYPHFASGTTPYIFRGLGIEYNIAGDLKKSSHYYYRFLMAGVELKSTKYIVNAIANYAIGLNEYGLPDSALALSRPYIDSTSVPAKRRLYLLLNMAEAWRLKKDDTQCAVFLQKAEQLLQEVPPGGERSDMVMQAVYIRSRLLSNQQSYAQSNRILLPFADSLRNRSKYRSRDAGKLFLQAGLNYNENNQPDSALWFYHQALYTVSQTDSANVNSLPALKDMYAENTLMDALDGMANAWDEKYKIRPDTNFAKAALQCRQLAFETEKKLLETFTYDEAMSRQLIQSKSRSKKALQNCYALWAATKNGGWVEQALQVAEKSKAVVLLHSVNRNRAALGNNADSLLSQLQQLRYQEIVLVKELSNVADEKVKDSLLRQQQNLNSRYLVLESELNQRHPELKRSGIDYDALGFEKLSATLLPPGACLLEYFEADSLTCVIWAGGDGASGLFLPYKNITDEISAFAQKLQTPDAFLNDSTAFYKQAAHCTAGLLPPPVQAALLQGRYTRLLVIPDGHVSLLPFEALVPQPGRFLIEYAPVTTGYSVSTLLTNYNAADTKGNRLAIFTPFSKNSVQKMPRLPFTNNEAGAVLRQFPQGVRYDAQEADVNHFWKDFKEADIIHIASHAKAMDSLPPRIIFYDSIISMPELYAGNTHARLVVLSACQTGAGAIDPNEGPLSLSRAFYYAGARNVINSLWQVNDDATAEIFGHFYTGFAKDNVMRSLRQAKLNYLHTAGALRRGPYYWAGLVHTGYENEANLGKQKNAWWWAMAVLPLAAGLYYYNRRRKR
jgi:CHAT domain-containing protein